MSKKDDDTDKAFEAALKGNMGWKCSCSLDIIDKKSNLINLHCKECGKSFKSNVQKDYCFDCEKKVKKTKK
jgi:transcription elongation factor Elf1